MNFKDLFGEIVIGEHNQITGVVTRLSSAVFEGFLLGLTVEDNFALVEYDKFGILKCWVAPLEANLGKVALMSTYIQKK